VGTPIPITNGSVTLNSTGTFTVTPATGYVGTLTFPYSLTSPSGSVLTANNTVLVVGLVDDARTTAVNTPVTYDPKPMTVSQLAQQSGRLMVL
jgi:hypothetical protein